MNKNAFTVIDSEIKAYWLGFIYADGCVSIEKHEHGRYPRFSINLAEKDSEHLCRLADFLNLEIIHYLNSDKRTGKVYKGVRLRTGTRKFCDSLIERGIVPRKSVAGSSFIYKDIPPKFIRHFIRGVSDGDGHIGKVCGNEHRWMLCGTDDFLRATCSFIHDKTTIITGSICARKGVSVLALGGNFALITLRNFLYDQATIWLERKRAVFESIKPPNSSGYKGVHWDSRKQRWVASKYVDGRRLYAGTSFLTAADAASAYCRMFEPSMT